MRYFFTSDYHLGHANIMKYCGRTLFMTPKDRLIYNRIKDLSQEEQRTFKLSEESLDRMNRGIIQRHNERVKPEDTVYHIGDFCFKNTAGGKGGEGIKISANEWEKRLNGKIIHIKGNHDKNNSTKTNIYRVVIEMSNRRINLVHDPDFAAMNCELNFTGHIHRNWKIKRFRKGCYFTDCINVGVDVWNFYPVTFEEIMSRYARWLKGMKRYDNN